MINTLLGKPVEKDLHDVIKRKIRMENDADCLAASEATDGAGVGHNPLPFPDVTEVTGKACYCGRHGCMETWVSGRAFEAQYTCHTNWISCVGW